MRPSKTKIPEPLRKAIFNNPEWILHDSELLNHLIITERKSGSEKVVSVIKIEDNIK